jgi:recombination protein RecT
MTDKNALAERKQTPSERFALAVERQFSGEVGNLHFSPYEKTLAQHLFIKVDAAIAEAEAKRKEGFAPIVWENVNMRKLAIDAVNRVQLGIDALIPGSVYPIAYFNGKTKKYDIDLRVGYRGELFYKVSASVKPIRNVRIELVYTTDEFTVYKAGVTSRLEGYDFKITHPFARGELMGGFGYIEYEDEKDNVLVVLSKAEIEKFRGTAKNSAFWADWYEQMAYKTIVHRTMGKIIIDPAKINVTAMAQVEADGNRPMLPDEPAPASPDDPPLALPVEDATVDDAPDAAQTGEEEPF